MVAIVAEVTAKMMEFPAAAIRSASKTRLLYHPNVKPSHVLELYGALLNEYTMSITSGTYKKLYIITIYIVLTALVTGHLF
jgi:hypothetical protein